MNHLSKLAIATVLLASAVNGAVDPSVTTSGLGVSIKNSTVSPWRIGGVRFKNSGKQWTTLNSWAPPGNVINNNPNQEVEIYLNSTADGTAANLKPGTSMSWSHQDVQWGQDGSGFKPIAGSEVALLRTGAPGVPDDPAEADPITLQELDSLIGTPNFYNPDYRYDEYDSLGVNGGKYSGGFMDTWIGETQLHFAYPTQSFRVNGTDVTVKQGKDMPHYWLSLAIGQEFLRADAQWMFGMGAKETGIGTTFPVGATNQGGVYGFWQVEDAAGGDRALGYPQFFPKYEKKLAGAADVTSSGIDVNEMLSYYTRGDRGETPQKSALILNSMFLSIIFQYVNYDVCSYATDICWKYGLENATDRYMGLGAMTAMYNLGAWSRIGDVAAVLNPTTVDATIADPNARNRFAIGNGNYRPDILNVVQTLVSASKEFEINKNPNTSVIDYEISLDQLRDMFFGDGGTVAKQGNGGLLLHYYDPTIGDFSGSRQKIWNTLESAFTIVKGKAPTASANTMSYRYDLLSVLRTIKADVPFVRRFQIAGDASMLIPQNSGHFKSGCSGSPAADEKYPYATFSTSYDNVSEVMTIVDTMKDNNLCGDVKWSIDNDWKIWNAASILDSSSATKRIYSIDVPKAMAKGFQALPDGVSGHFVWIMSTDGSGNSVINKLPLEFKEPTNLDSARALDTDGNGIADRIEVQCSKAVPAYERVDYSWPAKAVITAKALPTEDSGKRLIISNSALSGGAANGAALSIVNLNDDGTIKTLSTSILDRVGPSAYSALLSIDDKNRQFDTLKVTPTEPLKSLDKTDWEYLNFKKVGGSGNNISSSKVEISGNTVLFFFPKDGITSEDSVKFIDNGIEDTVGNKPMTISIYVEIQKSGGKEPEVAFAAVYDKNGDGVADSGAVKLTLGTAADKFIMKDALTKEESWPTDIALKTMNSFTVRGDDSCTFIPNFNDGFGEGLVSFTFQGTKEITGKLLDRVGPAAFSATLSLADKNRLFDTLKVTSTEPLKTINKTDWEYLNLRTTASSGSNFASSKVEVNKDTLLFLFPKDGIKDQDLVKFIANGIEDIVGNKPLTISRYVPIKKSGGKEPIVTFAAVYDKNGDGKADSAGVKLALGEAADKFIMSDATSKQESWPTQSVLKSMNSSINVGDDSCTFVPSNSTGNGEGRVVFSFTGIADISGPLVDRVGPAIVNDPASLVTYSLPHDSVSNKTYVLELTVSEPIGSLTDGNNYLEFRLGSAGTGTVIAIPTVKWISGDKWQFIFKNNDLKEYDHVRIIPDGDLKDKATQPNSAQLNNQWVPFKLIDPNNTPKVTSSFVSYENSAKAQGNGDRITVQFTISSGTEAYTATDVKKVRWTWNGKADSSSTLAASTSGKEVTLAINDLNLQGFGSGFGELVCEKIGSSEIVQFSVIDDRVGPAITVATCFRSATSGGTDTLEIEVSEPLKTGTSGDYFHRFAGSENGNQSSFSVNSFAGTGTKYRSLVDANTLSVGDWINFTSDKGIADGQNNQPLDRNQKVPVTITGSMTPAISQAQMYDANGDGVADSIRVELILGTDPDAHDAYDLDNGSFSWPTKSPMIDTAAISKENATVLSFNTFGVASTSGEGVVKLTFPSGETSGKLIDKVGPVLQSAKLYENNSGNDDTLLITFSEPVQGVKGASELLNIVGNKYTKEVVMISESKWLVTFNHSDGIAFGQEAMIVSESSIRDTLNNSAHKNNIKVKIEMIYRPIGVRESESGFRDTDSDGEMDQLQIKLEKTVNTDRIKDFTVQFGWPSESDRSSIKTVNSTAGNIAGKGDELTIDLTGEQFYRGVTSIESGKYGNITLAQPDDLTNKTDSVTFTGQDWMAPVLVNYAEYHGIQLTEDLAEFDDTVKLNFSEEIEGIDFGSGNDKVFGVIGKSPNTTYRINVADKATISGTTVTVLSRIRQDEDPRIPAPGDSIRILGEDAVIRDLHGNTQEKQTPYVPFTAVLLPAEYEVIVVPNPFKVIEPEVNGILRDKYGKSEEKVQAIIIRPYGNRVGENLSASITIYDAVSNIIVPNEEFEFIEDKGVLLFSFDGKNNVGRSLGSGIYQAQISVKSQSGDVIQQDVIPVKLGIKH